MEHFIEDLAQFLQDNDIGTMAEDLFIGVMTPEPDNQVMIIGTGGVEPNRYLPIEQPTVQVTVRNTDSNEAEAKAWAIYDLLHQKYDDLVLTAGGVDVMKVDAMQLPTPIGQDNESRHIYTVNFVFMVRRNND